MNLHMQFHLVDRNLELSSLLTLRREKRNQWCCLVTELQPVGAAIVTFLLQG